MKTPSRFAPACLLVLVGFFSSAFGCDGPRSPTGGSTPPATLDTKPPIFADPRPSDTVSIVNATAFSIDVTDDGSGIARVSASTTEGMSLPVTSVGSRFSFDVSGLPEGPVTVEVRAEDVAGNVARTTFSTVLDRLPPVVAFSARPPEAQETIDASLTLALAGSISDPHLDAARLEVRDPGSDGRCDTADDTLWPAGSEPGSVSVNRVELQVSGSSLRIAGEALVDLEIVLRGPEPRDVVSTYCVVAMAEDSARDVDGGEAANRASESVAAAVTWSAPPVASFAVQLDAWYEIFRAFSGDKTGLCLLATTSPARPSKDYAASLSGPNVTTAFNGRLDASGAVSLRQLVDGSSGRYTWTVTVEDSGEVIERSATVDVSPSGSGRSCQ